MVIPRNVGVSSTVADRAPVAGDRTGSVTERGDASWPHPGACMFIAGLPYWCVSVALAHRGRVVLGVVDAPAVGRRYVAIRGQGARRDGRRLQVRPPVDARDARNAHIPVMLTTGTARRAYTAGVRLNPRVMGSTALDLAVVAEGSAVASVAVRPHVWDIAAGSLLVTEAGGDAVHLRGDPLLPLRSEVDHRDLAVPFAAAAERAYVQDLAAGLLAG
jgi:myo-inositol-1(or 4)-monophosphatase